MELSKFVSNSVKVLKEIKREGSGEDGTDNDEEAELSKPTKILGAMWDPEDDTLSFPYTKLLGTELSHTKRGISKIIPAIYDTTGEIPPFILRVKVILSMTWAFDKSNANPTTVDSSEHEEKQSLPTQGQLNKNESANPPKP